MTILPGKKKGTRKRNANILRLMLFALYLCGAEFTSQRLVDSAVSTAACNIPGSHAALTQMEQLGEVVLQAARDPGYLSGN